MCLHEIFPQNLRLVLLGDGVGAAHPLHLREVELPELLEEQARMEVRRAAPVEYLVDGPLAADPQEFLHRVDEGLRGEDGLHHRYLEVDVDVGVATDLPPGLLGEG